MNWSQIKRWIGNREPRWLRDFRWSLGLLLLRREHRDVRDSLWDIMMCDLDDYRLSPPTIQLNVETGHNQIIQINNGARTIHIHLSAKQVIVHTWAKYMDGEEEENISFGDGYSVMMPYKPSEIRSLVEASRLSSKSEPRTS